MSEIYAALESARLRRQAQEQNSTRMASCVLSYDTDGVGEATTTGPLDFGMSFIEPPIVATGAVAMTLPDITTYRYPTVSAGVWKWVTKATSDPTAPLYTGAWLFFVVQCDPRTVMRTNGDDQDYWQAVRERTIAQIRELPVNSAEHAQFQLALHRVQAQLLESQHAQYLAQHPPTVTIRHHLTFSGVASQAYSFSEAFTTEPTAVPVTFF